MADQDNLVNVSIRIRLNWIYPKFYQKKNEIDVSFSRLVDERVYRLRNFESKSSERTLFSFSRSLSFYSINSCWKPHPSHSFLW